jgi:type I restriction enzyme S subunit
MNSTTTLKEVSELITKGTTPSSVGCEFVNEGINFIKSESIYDSKYLNSSIYEHINVETDNKLKRSRIKEGDLLFSIAGAYLGKIAIVQSKDVPANTNQAVGIVRLKKDIVDVNYVYYYFSQRNINAYINKLSSQSSQPNLNLDLLGKLEFQFKHIDDQVKIASVLSALDSKIELNNRINAELELMAKTIYDYWFLQFDFPIENGKPYKSSGGKMIWNEELKREIPEGWEVDKISKKVIIGSGFPFDSIDYNKDGLYKVITIKNVQDGFLDTSSVNYVSLLPKKISEFCILKVGDILMSLTGNVGRMCFVDQNNLLLNQRVGKLIGEKDFVIYSYFFFKRPENQQRLSKIANGSSQANLSPIEAIKDNFVIPSKKTMDQFAEFVHPMIDQILSKNRENLKLTELRDWLLPLLMNGQVKVN